MRSCNFADCGAPFNIANGTVSTPQGTLESANATYNCSSGYGLSGGATQTCVNGNWSGTLPTCLKGNKLISLYVLIYYNSTCAKPVINDLQKGFTLFAFTTAAFSQYTCTLKC